jgi:hypothetical protein
VTGNPVTGSYSSIGGDSTSLCSPLAEAFPQGQRDEIGGDDVAMLPER